MFSTKTHSMQAWERTRQAWAREEGVGVADIYAVGKFEREAPSLGVSEVRIPSTYPTVSQEEIARQSNSMSRSTQRRLNLLPPSTQSETVFLGCSSTGAIYAIQAGSLLWRRRVPFTRDPEAVLNLALGTRELVVSSSRVRLIGRLTLSLIHLNGCSYRFPRRLGCSSLFIVWIRALDKP